MQGAAKKCQENPELKWKLSLNDYLESHLTLTREERKPGACGSHSPARRPPAQLSAPAPSAGTVTSPAAGGTKGRGRVCWCSPETLSSLDKLGLKGILRRAERKTNLSTGSVQINIINLTGYRLFVMKDTMATGGVFTESKIKDKGRWMEPSTAFSPKNQLLRLKNNPANVNTL